MKGSDDSVKVALNIRPLIASELLDGCTNCVTVTPGEPQVQIDSHVFTFDHVYGSSGQQSCRIFEECIMPLVDAVFRGYNATVLGYGQTGSGKTYTMGTGETNAGGVIPQVMEEIFEKVNKRSDNVEFLIRVSFIEIFNEEVFDLLDPQTFGQQNVQIKETALGDINLAGVSEQTVKSKEEMASFLARGSSNRATASTHMNSQSSRSHAVFTICIEQKRTASSSQSNVGDDILISKLHLVDLAGSESAKRIGACGLRFKEGIKINKGLLALGNVIRVLSDEKKCKEGAFVPYRDSKLTRLLQDSLGGNSKTVMIACISPADSNAEETINTLKYANQARNIRNKAVINRNPVAAEMQRLRSQIEQLQAVCSGGASLKEIQILQDKVSELEMENRELHGKCNDLAQKATDAQDEIQRIKSQKKVECREKDMLICELKLEIRQLGAQEQKLKEVESLVRSLESCCQSLQSTNEKLCLKINEAETLRSNYAHMVSGLSNNGTESRSESENDDPGIENDGSDSEKNGAENDMEISYDFYDKFIMKLGYDLPCAVCTCTGTAQECSKRQTRWIKLLYH